MRRATALNEEWVKTVKMMMCSVLVPDVRRFPDMTLCSLFKGHCVDKNKRPILLILALWAVTLMKWVDRRGHGSMSHGCRTNRGLARGCRKPYLLVADQRSCNHRGGVPPYSYAVYL